MKTLSIYCAWKGKRRDWLPWYLLQTAAPQSDDKQPNAHWRQAPERPVGDKPRCLVTSASLILLVRPSRYLCLWCLVALRLWKTSPKNLNAGLHRLFIWLFLFSCDLPETKYWFIGFKFEQIVKFEKGSFVLRDGESLRTQILPFAFLKQMSGIDSPSCRRSGAWVLLSPVNSDSSNFFSTFGVGLLWKDPVFINRPT